jgi:flagellar biosynthesis protein FlhF
MRLRRYTAADLPEAMARIRQSLGPDAIILSTDEELGGGVLVTAAVEDQAESDAESAVEELDPGSIAFLQKILEFHRPPRNLADCLLETAAAAPSTNWTLALSQSLAARFSFKTLEDQAAERPLMLVGLPGAGKTAAAAKLALAARLEERPVLLITLDGDKAGSLAQIHHFAQTLEAQVKEATTPNQLAAACASAAAGALILIDTAGCNPFEPDRLALLKDFSEASRAGLVQVVAAGGDSLEAAEVSAAFTSIGAAGLLVTKMDTARRLGAVLSAAGAGQLALTAFGNSPRIGEGLCIFTPRSLAELLAAKASQAAENDLVTEIT